MPFCPCYLMNSRSLAYRILRLHFCFTTNHLSVFLAVPRMWAAVDKKAWNMDSATKDDLKINIRSVLKWACFSFVSLGGFRLKTRETFTLSMVMRPIYVRLEWSVWLDCLMVPLLLIWIFRNRAHYDGEIQMWFNCDTSASIVPTD